MKPFQLGNFQPKEKVESEDFIIRKLTAADAKIDYEAVMGSMEAIKQQRGGSWPTPELSYEDDWLDLAWHQREFETNGSFAFVVTNKGGDKELGCVYFYPPGHPMNSTGANAPDDADVIVNMWVTNEAYKDGLYPKLWRFIEQWLKTDWPFKNPYFSNPLKP